ncbi:MAG: cytochrome c peroxidase, partial [Planctomycetota bacterium]
MRPTVSWLAAASGAALLLPLLGSAPASARSAEHERRLVELGRRLFLEPAASRGGRFSCASCHDPEHGFSDPRPVSEDENGPTRRHSQTVVDLEDGNGMHWDGEFDTLRELLVARVAPPSETLRQTLELHKRHFESAGRSGLGPSQEEFNRRVRALTPPYYGPAATTPATVLRTPITRRLEEDGRYDAAFFATYGDPRVTEERVMDALEAYLKSLQSHRNAFDRYREGDPEALDASARRGLALFEGKANCASCHASGAGAERAPLADRAYHNTGLSFRSATLEFDKPLRADGGLGEMSFVADDLGRFKTPTLRDVALRPPYMHDGSLATLEDVVSYYDRGGTANGHLDAAIKPLDLTGRERADLVSFLQSLTGGRRAGLASDGWTRPSRTQLRIVDVQGRPVSGLTVEIHPCGDRIADAPRRSPPAAAVTDSKGWIVFAFPPATHVRLSAEEYEIGLDRMLPDT